MRINLKNWGATVARMGDLQFKSRRRPKFFLLIFHSFQASTHGGLISMGVEEDDLMT